VQSFTEAIDRFSSGKDTPADVALVQEVLALALSARELSTRLARLESLVESTGRDRTNESKRQRNEVSALEADVKVLQEALKRRGA